MNFHNQQPFFSFEASEFDNKWNILTKHGTYRIYHEMGDIGFVKLKVKLVCKFESYHYRWYQLIATVFDLLVVYIKENWIRKKHVRWTEGRWDLQFVS